MIIKIDRGFTTQHILVDRVKSGKKEYLEDLYSKYYYIVDKYCKKYQKSQESEARELAENILRDAIIQFCNNVKIGEIYRISSFIHTKFHNFDAKLLQLKKLEKKAFNGNLDAKKAIFNRYQTTINKYIDIFYNYILKLYCEQMISNNEYSFLDEDFIYPDNIINKNEIIQDYYLKAWDTLNYYYDSLKFKSSFCHHLHCQLKSYTVKKENNFTNLFNFSNNNINFESLDNKLEFDFENQEENNKIIKKLSNIFSKNELSIYKQLYNGLTQAEIARNIGVTRQCINYDIKKMKKKIKKIDYY